MIEKISRGVFRKLSALGLSLVVGVGALGMSPAGVQAQRSPNPYPFGKSTYWAWQNRPDLPSNLGEPEDWNDNAAKQGWPVSAYPRPGSIAVFERGVLGPASAGGHVAVVRQVLETGAFTTTQMDASDCSSQGSQTCGRVNTRQYERSAGLSFIHYEVDTRTTWGFAGGASGWTPSGITEGAQSTPGWRYTLTSRDALLLSPELDIPLDAYNTVEIVMLADKAPANLNLQLYFATENRPQFAPERRAVIAAKNDGARHTYRIYLGGHAGWSGKLTRLRLNLKSSGTGTGVRVDRIRLVNTDPDTSIFNARSAGTD